MGNSLQVLNGSPEWEGPVRPASEVATHFQKTMLFFKSEFMTEDGHGVDYEQLSLSPKFKEYCDESRELQKVTLDTLTNDERKAFFISKCTNEYIYIYVLMKVKREL